MFDEIIMRTPVGRFGRPEEMAGAAIFLLLAHVGLRDRLDHIRRRRLRDQVIQSTKFYELHGVRVLECMSDGAR
jgi:NAD(P)-dependent dehydrogenase (short-subunit alcohol dehydrogenase family)